VSAKRSSVAAVLAGGAGNPAWVAGRVLQIAGERAAICDETGTLWVELDPPRPDLEPGAWVEARGRWLGTHLQGTLGLLGLPRRPFPAPDGEWRSLRESGRLQRLRARARMLAAVRAFFDDEGFLEVETPTMVPSPGLDPHLDAYRVEGLEGADARWLITSPEYQMKRLLAGGAERIYQTARCFRRGERGPLHEPEFTMVEWYRAFAGVDDVMRDTETLVAHVARATLGGTTIAPAHGASVDVAPPWERLTVRDAFRRYAGVEMDAVLPDEERFFRLLVEAIEPRLGRERPVFLTHWPITMASLARSSPEDPSVCERFEAYVAGVELCNGFGELVDPDEQRLRLERDQRAREAMGKPVYPIDERFVASLEEGIPPSGGNALGFDRLVMLLLGTERVQDVVALPYARL